MHVHINKILKIDMQDFKFIAATNARVLFIVVKALCITTDNICFFHCSLTVYYNTGRDFLGRYKNSTIFQCCICHEISLYRY